MPDFERDREIEIMTRWRAGKPLDKIVDYVGMEMVDVCAIIQRNLNNFPSLGWRDRETTERIEHELSELTINLSPARAQVLMERTTTTGMRKHLQVVLDAA